MENYNKYLLGALEKHGSIVLPHIGSLITQEKTAEIIFINKVIVPYKKQIFFNSNHAESNGLLEQYIAEITHSDIESTKKNVSNFFKNILETLKKGDEIAIPQIGNFTLKNNSEIHFTQQDNNTALLPDTYGLPILNLQPIEKSDKIEAIKDYVRHENNPIHEALTTPKTYKRKLKTKTWWLLPLALILAWASIYGFGAYILHNTFLNDFNFPIFSFFKNSANNTVKNKTIDTTFIYQSKIDTAKTSTVDTIHTDTIKTASKAVSSLPNFHRPKLKYNYTYYLDQPALPFYVVVAQCRSESTANNMKQMLLNNGEDARIVKVDQYYCVSYFYFVKKIDIDSILAFITQHQYPNAFLLNNLET